MASREKLLPIARLQVLQPKPDFSFVIADVGNVSSVRADAGLREGAILFVFQAHQVARLLRQKGFVAVFVEGIPFIDEFLVFLAGHIEKCPADVACVLSQGQDVIERFAAVFLVDEAPKRIACNLRFVIAQVVDFLVIA